MEKIGRTFSGGTKTKLSFVRENKKASRSKSEAVLDAILEFNQFWVSY